MKPLADVTQMQNKNLGRVFSLKLTEFSLESSVPAIKRDEVSVNVSPLLRATAGNSLLAERGKLYNEAKLQVS